MRRRRWPAAPPPTTEGLPVTGAAVLVSRRDVNLRVTEIVAYPTGMEVRLDLTVRGRSAHRARHETRPLDDPDDPSARWSYLAVSVRVDDLEGEADPRHPPAPSKAARSDASVYHTQPLYWIGAYPRSGSITITAGWTQIGLKPMTTTIRVGPNPSVPAER
ncbi:MAG: hypothetical protein WAW17_29970 [Rhodococcus sp. (in: high G+C Gram-positive bacteria)]|uniref:hypothetical protein n=1 Tax=Rhodococcus sp. TaxID=1831 RepID=UPI003BAEA6B0